MFDLRWFDVDVFVIHVEWMVLFTLKWFALYGGRFRIWVGQVRYLTCVSLRGMFGCY